MKDLNTSYLWIMPPPSKSVNVCAVKLPYAPGVWLAHPQHFLYVKTPAKSQRLVVPSLFAISFSCSSKSWGILLNYCHTVQPIHNYPARECYAASSIQIALSLSPVLNMAVWLYLKQHSLVLSVMVSNKTDHVTWLCWVFWLFPNKPAFALFLSS
jgi:hypothetical protein